MRTATLWFPAIVILAGFFLIRIYLYRLPIASVLHGSSFGSFVGVADDASTKVNETVKLAPEAAPSDRPIQATATSWQEAPAMVTQTALSSLDQIVVMGRTNSEDTSWVEKLPT